MDILFLHGIKIKSILGVFAWEQVALQTLLLDLDLTLPNSRAGRTDDIEDTIDYADLISRLRSYTQTCSHQLLESLAEDIADFLMREFNLPQVKVRLVKPGILNDVAQVGIEIVRGSEML
ncbi:MAG: dihydroneopterin aldolase [Neisseriaceae bacterium]|nr:dihydroneopterin aldolase [Neisseriaceae bacterium]